MTMTIAELVGMYRDRERVKLITPEDFQRMLDFFRTLVDMIGELNDKRYELMLKEIGKDVARMEIVQEWFHQGGEEDYYKSMQEIGKLGKGKK